MSADKPDDFFGIEYDCRTDKKSESSEKSPAVLPREPHQQWDETQGTVERRSDPDGSQTIATSFGSVRFDTADDVPKTNFRNPLLQELKKLSEKENFIESHMFKYEKNDNSRSPAPAAEIDSENLIESQMFRYQRANIPSTSEKQKQKPPLITKSSHGKNYYGSSPVAPAVKSTGSHSGQFRFRSPVEEKPTVSVESKKTGPTPEKPITTAEDFVKKLRRDEFVKSREIVSEKDRDGSLLALEKIWHGIPALHKMSSDEIVDLIIKGILYDNGDLVAIEKPYGLPIHGGPGVQMHLAKLLPKIGERLKPAASYLHVVHRIDKNTTGICLLTRSHAKATEISKLIADRQLLKKYWCLTVRVPNPPEGIINIPLQHASTGGKYKMLLAAQAKVGSTISISQTSSAIQAQTDYSTLSVGSRCALVECKIYTGVKHQIRSHLGFGISCPILGDHKYSDYMGMLPQRLPSEVLQNLGIRSQKSRDLPTYLHAKEVHIPDSDNGNAMLYIKSPLPKFFTFAMRSNAMFLVSGWAKPDGHLIVEAAFGEWWDCPTARSFDYVVLKGNSYQLCRLMYHLGAVGYMERLRKLDRRLRRKRGWIGLILNISNPPSFPLDLIWNWKIEVLGQRTHEMEKLMWVLSSVGGACSAMGDHVIDFALKAQAISMEQLRIAFRFGDPFLVARCRLFIALSYIQTGHLRAAKTIIRCEYQKALTSGYKGGAVANICKGIWAKLQYVWTSKRRHNRNNLKCR